ncbi:PadR family transcriptional regulator [Gandjariella thermophila]|uniref:PadR family transcriptional regulator n=1 Tax=Gandjariella thermophila TaxID=1931992 RepID=A0A4D4JB17_9PSEU|nr:PadR family transcriptional regulator [Gandjariella thermophila]GDY31023.1 PadR family transcriptional regulator [Gandjariella thermophila]
MPDTTARPPRRSSLAMAVLLLLSDEPMHPYGLRQRIQEWDKDRVVNVSQRNAIYQTIERLERSGLITVLRTTRQERRPERTVYQATEEGVATAGRWLREMLSTPAPEFPEFPAALAFLPSLPGPTVLDALRARVAALETNIARLDKEVADRVAEFPGGVDRIHLVEIDYLRAMWQAELNWVRDLVDDLGPRLAPGQDG